MAKRRRSTLTPSTSDRDLQVIAQRHARIPQDALDLGPAVDPWDRLLEAQARIQDLDAKRSAALRERDQLVRQLLAGGESVAALARFLDVSRAALHKRLG